MQEKKTVDVISKLDKIFVNNADIYMQTLSNVTEFKSYKFFSWEAMDRFLNTFEGEADDVIAWKFYYWIIAVRRLGIDLDFHKPNLSDNEYRKIKNDLGLVSIQRIGEQYIPYFEEAAADKQ